MWHHLAHFIHSLKNRTGPAVRPEKTGTGASAGLLSALDRPRHWTGKNRLNRGQPAGSALNQPFRFDRFLVSKFRKIEVRGRDSNLGGFAAVKQVLPTLLARFDVNLWYNMVLYTLFCRSIGKKYAFFRTLTFKNYLLHVGLGVLVIPVMPPVLHAYVRNCVRVYGQLCMRCKFATYLCFDAWELVYSLPYHM